MSWLYLPSRLTSSACAPELEASISASSLPLEMPPGLSVTLRGKPIVPASYRRAVKTGILTMHLSGLMCTPSTARRGVAAWISSLQAIRASPSPSQAGGKGSKTSATCGHKSCDIFKQLSLPLFSVRTCPATLPWDLSKSAKTYRAWATALRQASSARLKSARPMSESASTFLPTPRAQDGKHAQATDWELGRHQGKDLLHVRVARQAMWPTPTVSVEGGPCHNLKPGGQVTLQTAVAMWPTPTTLSGGNSVPQGSQWVGKTTAYTPSGRKTSVSLESAVRQWPTPQAHDAQKGNPARVGRYGTRHGGRNLNDEVAMWPTPLATEDMSSSGPNAASGTIQSGLLNPMWVESYLMGYPIGWTALERLAMPLCPK